MTQRTRWHMAWQWVGTLALILGLALVIQQVRRTKAALLRGGLVEIGSAPIDLQSLHLVKDRPTHFEPFPSKLHGPLGQALPRILRQVEPTAAALPASLCLHVLNAHGLDGQFQSSLIGSSQQLLRLFTNDAAGRAYFGAPVIFRTRSGLRVRSSPDDGAAREKHYDQTLGCFAQLGLPLSLPIQVGGASLALRDLLRDSIASFDLRQVEIEWTAIAFTAYLPPHRSWVNKFGDHFSFDQLADELERRDLTKASCCGCHVVEAMLQLLRVNEEVATVLTPAVRDRLAARLQTLVRAVAAEQASDGSWGPRWFGASGSQAATAWPDTQRVEARLLATSHLAHLLMNLPPRLALGDDRLQRSLEWLDDQLKDVDQGFVQENFCPCSHGAWVLRIASSWVSMDSAPPRKSAPNSPWVGPAPVSRQNGLGGMRHTPETSG